LEKYLGKEVMSSYEGLYVNGEVAFAYRNEVDLEIVYLFSEDAFLHLKGIEATKYVPGWDIDNMSPEEIEEIDAFVCIAPAGVLKDRLSVLGFSETLVEEVFEELLKEDIERAATLDQRYLSDDSVNKELEKRLDDLQKLNYDTWM
jgi:hypothetical protein